MNDQERDRHMRKLDFQKTADELESDSCFDLLSSCNNRIAQIEAEAESLRAQVKILALGSIGEQTNLVAQRTLHGQLCGLAYMQGALEAQCRMKSSLAAIVREREASQEVA